MIPRKPLLSWQLFAQTFAAANSGFAPTHFLSHNGFVGGDLAGASCSGAAPHCDPFPKNSLSPVGVERLFHGVDGAVSDAREIAETVADGATVGGNFPFVSMFDAVGLRDKTPPTRGKISCASSSFFFLSQPRLPAVCKTPVRARSSALLPVRPLRTQPMKTWLQARPLAALQALQPAPFPARWAADPIDLTAFAAGLSTKPAIHGANPHGWLFHFRPARAALT